jgi:hypothetical protein
METIQPPMTSRHTGDNPNTTQTLEYTKDKYNVKIRKRGVSPKVPPTTYKGRRKKVRKGLTIEHKADNL